MQIEQVNSEWLRIRRRGRIYVCDVCKEEFIDKNITLMPASGMIIGQRALVVKPLTFTFGDKTIQSGDLVLSCPKCGAALLNGIDNTGKKKKVRFAKRKEM
jgi:predicted RNA-binding Zn-ribbon protein involved in translation (DUF1610 family)